MIWRHSCVTPPSGGGSSRPSKFPPPGLNLRRKSCSSARSRRYLSSQPSGRWRPAAPQNGRRPRFLAMCRLAMSKKSNDPPGLFLFLGARFVKYSCTRAGGSQALAIAVDVTMLKAPRRHCQNRGVRPPCRFSWLMNIRSLQKHSQALRPPANANRRCLAAGAKFPHVLQVLAAPGWSHVGGLVVVLLAATANCHTEQDRHRRAIRESSAKTRPARLVISPCATGNRLVARQHTSPQRLLERPKLLHALPPVQHFSVSVPPRSPLMRAGRWCRSPTSRRSWTMRPPRSISLWRGGLECGCRTDTCSRKRLS